MEERALEECASFFRKNKAYAHMFAEMRRKYRKYGKLTGKICLGRLTEKEREALGAVFGKSILADDFQFSVKELQEALDETKYRGVGAAELVEKYFRERIVSNSQRKDEERTLKELFWKALLDEAEDRFGQGAGGTRWLTAAWEQRRYGYQLMMREREKSEDAVKEMLIEVCLAVEYLQKVRENAGVRLAVLGAEITKNPHCFDRQNAAGRLLINALSFIFKTKEPQAQEDVLALYYMSGIRPDDISSFTTCYGIHFYEGSEEFKGHGGRV